MVAALRVSRHGPAKRSAAFKKMPARSAKLNARHDGATASAVSIAALTSAGVASCSAPSAMCRRCGATTSMRSPAPIERWAPIAIVRSTCSAAISFRRISSRARCMLPGGYSCADSFVGLGTVVTASIASTPAPALAGAGLRLRHGYDFRPSWHAGDIYAAGPFTTPRQLWSVEEKVDLLRAVPLKLVVIETIDGELRVLVTGVSGIDEFGCPSDVSGCAHIVDMSRHHLVKLHRPHHDDGRRVKNRIQHDHVVGDVGGEHHPASTAAGCQKSQRGERG